MTNTKTRRLLPLILTLLLTAGAANASILTLTSFDLINGLGPISGNLDGQQGTFMCIDFFKYTSVPSAFNGTVRAYDANSLVDRLQAWSLFVLTHGMAVNAGLLNNNPLNPLDGSAVTLWQYVAWEAASSLTPDYAATIPAFGGGTVNTSSPAVVATNAGLINAQFIAALSPSVAAAWASFQSIVFFVEPHDKENQRFIGTSAVPEPATLGLVGVALFAIGLRKRR